MQLKRCNVHRESDNDIYCDEVSMSQKLTDQELLEKVQSTVAELYSQTSSLVAGLLSVSPMGMPGRYGSGTEYLKQEADILKQKNEELLELKKKFSSPPSLGLKK